MNLNKLKGKIVERDKTYQKCADYLGMSIATFSDKMNEKRKFYIDELDKLGNFLEMTDGEKADIFLH